MSKEEMLAFMIKHQIKIVIDATHPYAAVVSQNAISICQQMSITYLRFERAKSEYAIEHENIKRVDSYEETALYLKSKKANILLTTGSKTLEIFTAVLDLEKLYVRVLPTVESVQKCLDLGIKPSNIIAIQGPFSTDFNEALLKEYEIDILVSKDSGTIGGTEEKLLAARRLAIEVVLIKRPNIN